MAAPSSMHCVGLRYHLRVSVQHSFQIGFQGLQVFMNDDRTRTFLALGAAAGAQQVKVSKVLTWLCPSAACPPGSTPLPLSAQPKPSSACHLQVCSIIKRIDAAFEGFSLQLFHQVTPLQPLQSPCCPT